MHERPGVYSSYDASTVIRGGRAVRVIGVAAKAAAGTPNVPVTLTSYEGGLSAFGEDADGTPGMAAILSLLFQNGASTVVAVAVEEDDYTAAFAALGTEDSIRSRYPRHINLYGNAATQQALWGEAPQDTQAQAEALVEEQGYTLQNVQTYRTAAFGGVIEGNQIRFDNSIYSNRWDTIADICQFFVVPVADYNRVVGAQETLEADEVLIYSTKELSYGEDTIRLGDGPVYTVALSMLWLYFCLSILFYGGALNAYLTAQEKKEK